MFDRHGHGSFSGIAARGMLIVSANAVPFEAVGQAMTVLPELIAAYEARGFRVATGLNPTRFLGVTEVPYTWLIRDGENVTGGLGLALQELLFLECLCGLARPKRIFIIGNSFGWSTLALALMNRQASVVAIDSGAMANTREGIDLTNEMARGLGLTARVEHGTSPQDVPKIVRHRLDEIIDLAFIDGLHTNEQVVRDAKAVWPFMSDTGIMLFHDVLQYDMAEGFAAIERMTGLTGRVLHGTTSGIGVITANRDPGLVSLLQAFEVDVEARKAVYGWAQRYLRERRLRIWLKAKRSFLKRWPGARVPPKSTFPTGRMSD